MPEKDEAEKVDRGGDDVTRRCFTDVSVMILYFRCNDATWTYQNLIAMEHNFFNCNWNQQNIMQAWKKAEITKQLTRAWKFICCHKVRPAIAQVDQDMPKMGQVGHSMRPIWAKIAPKMTPEMAKIAEDGRLGRVVHLKWMKIVPKMTKHMPKMVEDGAGFDGAGTGQDLFV